MSLLITWDGKTGERQISLTLQADSTIEDVRAIWPLVMTEQTRLHDYGKKFQPAPNLKIDQRAYELKQQKKTNNLIADIISEEFELDGYSYKEVSDSLRRHKKRLGLL